jgi:hypothetical protein
VYFAPKGAGERVFLRWRAPPASAKTPLRKKSADDKENRAVE